ncbi:MAG: YggS family pyridoxal phosphate-dependent enzyme [Candidatus Omnitrophica bacterium]|nr:YggS family pyridoxal phosphate-dependent enzyme [Candidatus Omnitrophota bacterium]
MYNILVPRDCGARLKTREGAGNIMIQDNVRRIRERIAEACSRSNRHPDEIVIIAVTKGRTLSDINEAIEAGITDIGENRVQEALKKYNAIRDTHYAIRVKWHMVGHLQTNKAKEAVKIFDLIHSVDSLRLAEEIDKQAHKIKKVQDILIEANTSGEVSKFGFKAEGIIGAVKEIVQFKNIKVKGLMTIAPALDSPEKTRPYFRMLREIKDKINSVRILSMGMTDDFEVAIEEGANMVRLGRVIFEG